MTDPQDIAALDTVYRGLTTEALLRRAVTEDFPNIALVSSFGTESAVLLHIVSKIDKNLPVFVLDTEKLFLETLRYIDDLSAHLGLSNVTRLKPDPVVYQEDHDGTLWDRNYDRCCELRKVIPLKQALAPHNAWISGRKQYHGGERAALPPIERDTTHVKINPLYNWPFARIRHYIATHQLPDHPLLDMGYLSVGCTTCTAPASDTDDPRAGRWGDSDKTECGIHF